MIADQNGVEVIDPRYYSVCVEQTDYKPISFDEVMDNIVAQGGRVGDKP